MTRLGPESGTGSLTAITGLPIGSRACLGRGMSDLLVSPSSHH
jgi:hypothetical protein